MFYPKGIESSMNPQSAYILRIVCLHPTRRLVLVVLGNKSHWFTEAFCKILPGPLRFDAGANLLVFHTNNL